MNRHNLTKLTTLSIALFGIVAFCGSAAFAAAKAPPKVGETAPDFMLLSVDKTGYSLDDLRREKKATVIVFVSAKCPVVKKHRRAINKMAKKHRGKVQFVGINANNVESAKVFKKDLKKWKFLVLRDFAGTVSGLYGAQKTPTAYVVNSKLKIAYMGAADENLANAIDEVVAGKPVSKPEVAAFGCGIKRK